MPEENQQFRTDDADADARAAYAEVMSRTKEPEVEVEAAVAEPVTAVAEQKPAEGSDRARDEHGRFVKASDKPTEVATEAKTQAQPAAQQKAAEGEQPKPPLNPEAVASPLAGPPPSWSVAAKTKWDSLPAEIKSEIAKREGEVAEGFAALRDYKDLKQFNDMARSSGTTLAAAMQHYVNMENIIRRDPAAGLSLIAQNAGLSQTQAAQLFAGLAQKFGGGQPQGQQDQDPLAELVSPMLNPVMQKLQALEGQLTARQQQEAAAADLAMQKAIEEFANDPQNRFFSNLSDQIAQLFESGMVKRTGNPAQDLRNAYDMAAGMNAEVREALIEQRLQAQEEAKRKREQEAADKAKQASRSISGSRAPGTVIRDAEPESGADDVEADVRRAIRQLSHA
jgi:hypothetical protein